MALKILKTKSLLAILGNSIKGGDNYLFRNLYAINDGQKADILENGKNSCAAFVSWILLALELVKTAHAAVEGTIKDLMSSGWHEISEPKPGAILVWKKMMADDGVEHGHLGFYIGNDEAISNDSRGRGFPWKHHFTYNDTRKIEKIFWHDDLNNG